MFSVPIILTPTPRLARAMALDHARQQLANASSPTSELATEANSNDTSKLPQSTAWITPQILTFSGLTTLLCDAYFLSTHDERTLISNPQAIVLWEQIIDKEVFIGEPKVAQLAFGAWQRVHEYLLPRPDTWPPLLLSQDSFRMQSWAADYLKHCNAQGFVDEFRLAAELPEHIRQGHLSIPKQIECVGFDLPLTPLQTSILDACRDAGCEIVDGATNPANVSDAKTLNAYETLDDELTAAAKWAREQIETNNAQRVAIVLPDLAGHLPRVERILSAAIDPPGFALHSPSSTSA